MMQSLIAGLCGLFAVSASAFQLAPATAQSNEPRQQPVQTPAQSHMAETTEPKIKPHLIFPEAPKKQSRGYRP